MVDRAIQIWTFAPDMIDVTQNYVTTRSTHHELLRFRTVWLER